MRELNIQVDNFIIRPIAMDDLEQLYQIALKTGPGMTSLPADKELLKNKIQDSINSFMIEPTKLGKEIYFFVLELLAEKKVIGTAAIGARIGGFEPFYSYQIKSTRYISEELGINNEIQYLELKKEHDGPSIIRSLFIDESFRNLNFGRFLSRARFLFMAAFRNRFADEVIAELRGFVNAENKSPFWEGTVRHFFNMDFERADFLSAKGKGFIADLMPKFPLYIPLLKDEVIESIAKLHPDTVPAMKFLEAEGFAYDNHVDIFDAGPRINVKTDEITTIKNSKKAIVSKIADIESKDFYFATKQNSQAKDFVATMIKLQEQKDGSIVVDKFSALKLGLASGDSLIYCN